jgi:hypothetical protein
MSKNVTHFPFNKSAFFTITCLLLLALIMAPKTVTAEEQVIYAPAEAPTTPPDLRLLHYNDVYHIDNASEEPVGGIARFQTVVNYYRNDERIKGQPKLLTFFSGDAFNPSLESSVTKGR